MTTYRTLLRLMNLPHFDGVVRTSDGFYIGQRKGDVGYNHFLGAPAAIHPGPGLENTLAIWRDLSAAERKAVHAIAASPPDGSPIPLGRDFGVPDD